MITSLFGSLSALLLYFIKKAIASFSEKVRDVAIETNTKFEKVFIKLDELVKTLNRTDKITDLQGEQIKSLRSDLRKLDKGFVQHEDKLKGMELQIALNKQSHEEYR
ncbi:MAG: hypothetical protein N4A49_06695 [Marinifilaceae bacterium]|nr:hypothetical protein [Marinifilaceae bacterium]